MGGKARQIMKKNTYLLIALLAIGCGEDEEMCSSTKDLFSTWTNRVTGTIYLLQDCDFGTNCQITFGAGACDDIRGDFTIWFNEAGDVFTSNCADSIYLDSGTWEVSCENILSLTSDLDGSVNTLD